MDTEYKIALTVIYTVIFLIALLGNILVAYLVLKRPGMKSPTNLLLVNMAAADILFAVFMVPLATIRYHVRAQWIGGPFGDFSCHVMFFMSHLPIAGSTTTFTFIAFERFFAIMYPYKRIAFFSRVKLITLLIWLSSAVLMVPIGISAYTTQAANGQIQCDRHWSMFGDPQKVQQKFYTTTFILMYAGPLIVIGVVYVIICRKLWKHHAPGHVTVSSQQNETIHRRQVVRMLITVVVVFALCWLPVHAQHFIIAYRPDIYARIPLFVKVAMNLIGHANTAMNPCLLVWLNIRFRREFFRLCLRGNVAPRADNDNGPAGLETPNAHLNAFTLHKRASERQPREAWVQVATEG